MKFQEEFNVVVQTDIFPINAAHVVMTGKGTASIVLLWNCTGYPKGNYTIGASAGPLTHETNTSDNY